jgi:hypothetical protein
MGLHGDLESVLVVWQRRPCGRALGRMGLCRRRRHTGAWKWPLKSNYPIVSGMPPTAVGVFFFGDLGGNCARRGQRPEAVGQELGGAIM